MDLVSSTLRVPLPPSQALAVGRCSTNDVVVPLRLVGRMHAWVMADARGKRCRVADVDSRNGTWINGVRMSSGEAAWIKLGDEVWFGGHNTGGVFWLEPTATSSKSGATTTTSTPPPPQSVGGEGNGYHHDHDDDDAVVGVGHMDMQPKVKVPPAATAKVFHAMQVKAEQLFKRWTSSHLDLEEMERAPSVKNGNNRFEPHHFSASPPRPPLTRQVSAQYGRSCSVLVSRLMKELHLSPDSSRFCDMGSGIGTVCLQVALVVGCEAHGVELMPGRFDTAQMLRENLSDFVTAAAAVKRPRSSQANYYPQLQTHLSRVTFSNVDFTSPAVVSALSAKYNAFFVNNANGIFHARSSSAMHHALDWYVALIVAGTPGECRLACLDSISELDSEPLSQAFHKATFLSPEQAVTWTKTRVLVHVYTKVANSWKCPRCLERNPLVAKPQDPTEPRRIQDQCEKCRNEDNGMCRAMYLLRRNSSASAVVVHGGAAAAAALSIP